MVREHRRRGGPERQAKRDAAHEDLTLAARSQVTVLVTAADGVERARCARAIHRRGVRCRGPFVAVSCRPRRASRDGADAASRSGARDDAARLQESFDMADGGTLFIDEVAAMSARAQARLFGLLGSIAGAEGEADPGSVTSGVRVIAGATPALESAIAAGQFSRALFYRMNVIHLHPGRVEVGRGLATASLPPSLGRSAGPPGRTADRMGARVKR